MTFSWQANEGNPTLNKPCSTGVQLVVQVVHTLQRNKKSIAVLFRNPIPSELCQRDHLGLFLSHICETNARKALLFHIRTITRFKTSGFIFLFAFIKVIKREVVTPVINCPFLDTTIQCSKLEFIRGAHRKSQNLQNGLQ